MNHQPSVLNGGIAALRSSWFGVSHALEVSTIMADERCGIHIILTSLPVIRRVLKGESPSWARFAGITVLRRSISFVSTSIISQFWLYSTLHESFLYRARPWDRPPTRLARCSGCLVTSPLCHVVAMVHFAHLDGGRHFFYDALLGSSTGGIIRLVVCRQRESLIWSDLGLLSSLC